MYLKNMINSIYMLKGLYYYMNKRKKAGTSRKGKGTVTDKA